MKFKQENSSSQELQLRRWCKLKCPNQERQSETVQEPDFLGQERMESTCKKMTQCIKKDLKNNFTQTKTDKNEQTKSLGVFPSTRNMIKKEWYFDSGCSQHMTKIIVS